MSVQKRCVELCVFQNPCDIITSYCEVVVRILTNFLFTFSHDLTSDDLRTRYGKKKEVFLNSFSYLMRELFSGMRRLIHSSEFAIMFLTF